MSKKVLIKFQMDKHPLNAVPFYLSTSLQQVRQELGLGEK
jgi:hypothetical protein